MMPKYTVLKPVLHEGRVIENGEIDLTKEQATRLLEIEAVEETKRKRGNSDDNQDPADNQAPAE